MADIVQEAGEFYREVLGDTREQRDQIREDLKFSDPTDPQQWDEDEKRSRENDPGGARPCLVFDQTGQYVSNVAGQVEQRPPAIHALPVSGGADKRVAENLDGFFRHIEHASRAQQHYARALTSAARAGVGYLVVRPEYTDRALNYQEPRISSEADPLAVVFDPFSVELDGSDATRGQLLTAFSFPEFERMFGTKAAKVSFGDEDQKILRDDREQVLVAEDWRVVERTTNMVVYRTMSPNGEPDEGSLPEDEFWLAKQRDPQMQAVRTYSDKYRCVKWVRMSGAEILTKETEYPANGIGIIPVYGYVTWIDKRIKYCGIPRRARQAQQAYNFHMSEARAYQRQAPKSPWVVPARAVQKYGALWDRAGVDSRAYLPYDDIDETGQPIAAPQRAPVATNLQNFVQGAEQALHDIQAAIGMYQANLGAPSNEQSGVAIDARKQQGEASTAHFPSHLAASLGQVGKLCMEMIPRLIDTRRQTRILGIDMTPGAVTIDPNQKEALNERDDGMLTINPNVGQYDVRVVVGASFSTQRQQAQEAYTEMMRANPQMMPAIAPLWAQVLDVPYADKLAQVLTAMAPDPVKAILQPDQQDSVPALKAQVEQLQQQLQQAVQIAHEAQADADEAHNQLQNKHLEMAAKSDEIDIMDYEAQTDRLKVLGTTVTPDLVVQLAQQTVMQAMKQPIPSEGPEDAENEAQEVATPQQEAAGPANAVPTAAEPAEPAEPPGPSPDVMEMMKGHHALASSMMALAHALATPKKKIPVRDKAGNILHVIEAPMEDAPQEQA